MNIAQQFLIASDDTVSDAVLASWEQRFDGYLQTHMTGDAAHDVSHLARVWACARTIAYTAGGDRLVILAACYFHDIVTLPKNHPDRAYASSLSAIKTKLIMSEVFPDFSATRLQAVAHAIEAHSFSAGIAPLTLEAKIVQDADRLEALGAIGLARVFYIAGSLNQALFEPSDPFAQHRPLDDKRYALDHFQVKLLKIKKTMHTSEGRRIAEINSQYLIKYVGKLAAELSGDILGMDVEVMSFLQQDQNER